MSSAPPGTKPVRLDPLDKPYAINPFPVWAQLREQSPVAYSSCQGGFWVVTGYAQVFEVLHDPATYCSGRGIIHPRNPELPMMLLIETDPPLHGKLRSLLNAHLSPRRMAELRPEVERIVAELVDGFIERGECDLVDDFARPLPQIVLCGLFGMLAEEAATFQELMYTASRQLAETPEEARRAAVELNGFMRELVAERRASPDRDDLLGALLEGQVDGRGLTDDEVARLLLIVFAGGLNTVKSQLGGSFLYLWEHPDERDRLVQNPELIAGAVEELLRYLSPIQGIFRTVTKDTVLGGQELKAGDKVFVMFGSANRDEGVFVDGERCALDRDGNRHMAFGLGIHRCIGSHVARIEVRAGLEEVLRRLPDYRLRAGASVRWDVGPGNRGVDSLPVEFTPQPKRATDQRMCEE